MVARLIEQSFDITPITAQDRVVGFRPVDMHAMSPDNRRNR